MNPRIRAKLAEHADTLEERISGEAITLRQHSIDRRCRRLRPDRDDDMAEFIPYGDGQFADFRMHDATVGDGFLEWFAAAIDEQQSQ